MEKKTLTIIVVFIFSLAPFEFIFSQNLKTYDLIFSEIMFDPTPSVSLPELEFIEIYNNSDSLINLSEISLTIGSRSFVPENQILKPDSFIVFWDEEIPTLKNSGDSLKIMFGNNTIHRLDYTPSMHTSSFKRNGGWSLELIDFTKPCLTENNWNSSENTLGGTPGKSNSILNELSPLPIELLSYCPKNDSLLNIIFSVPIESLEMNNEYESFYNQVVVTIPKLDSNSIDSLFITNATTCYETRPFEALTLKYGLPLIPDSGDLVINELLFNPDEEGSDFIEIFNVSNKPINISSLYFCKKNNENELQEPFEISKYPILLMPNEYSVLCPNKSWLMNTFPKTKNITESNIPAMNNDEGKIVLLTHSAKIIDEIHYFENWHHNELIHYENVSLEKLRPTLINVSSNWSSASSVENYATPGYENSNFTELKNTTQNFELNHSVFTPDGDGYNDHLILQYNLSDVNWIGKIDVVNHFGETIHNMYSNILFGKKNSINWNGKLTNNTSIKPGIYALLINAYNTKTQKKIRKKLIFYVNGILE